jgi:hypothetical protein
MILKRQGLTTCIPPNVATEAGWSLDVCLATGHREDNYPQQDLGIEKVLNELHAG